jgi:hypothetical protein
MPPRSQKARCASGAARIAQVTLELATEQPELVFRNPEEIEQGGEASCAPFRTQ